MRKRVLLVIIFIFIQIISPVHAIKKDNTEVSILIPKYDWLSNQTIPISIYASNLALGEIISAQWELVDES